MIGRLHYITQDIENYSHAQLAELACQGGIRWVQLRLKNKPVQELTAIARETLKICKKYGANLIINDHVEVAKEIEADGVHLGKTDMNLFSARKLLGAKTIIGSTANTFEDIEKLAEARVDYIGLGPFRFTKTKTNLSPLLNIEGYKSIIQQCNNSGIKIPIIAIGGIVVDDLESLINTGLYGVAVASAIGLADNPVHAARLLTDRMDRINKKELV